MHVQHISFVVFAFVVGASVTIQSHAAVVTKFVENGYDEVHKNHALPEKPDPKKP